jgi:transcriptional regulator with XRE-family HTH domain
LRISSTINDLSPYEGTTASRRSGLLSPTAASRADASLLSFRDLPITDSQVFLKLYSLASMEARSLPEALKLIMKQKRCSQNQLARDLGKAQSWVSAAINGKRATELAKVIKILDRVGWEVRITPKTEDEDPVKRREFVAAAASVTFVPSPKVGPYQDPTYVRELARRTKIAMYEHGGATVASTAMRHIRQLTPVIMGEGRKLQEAASGLAVQTAWTLTDVRRFDLAENIGRLALELARRSESADAQSQAFSALAAVNRGQADRAVVYARHGVQLRDVPPAQQAWMRLRLGWSLALVQGQQKTSREVVESVRDLVGDSHGAYGWSSLDAADMMAGLGMALSDLGAYGEAHATLSEAVALLDQSAPNLQAGCVARQITSALRASQPSLAADRMLALARLTPLVNSPRIDAHVSEILAMSARWAGVPEMRDARAQLRTVTPPTAPQDK